MGDTRFEHSWERFEEARRDGDLAPLSPETSLGALATLAAQTDPMAANILATRLLNDFRRSATLLRFVSDGVVALDIEGRVVYANPAADELLGRPEGSLLSKDFHATTRHAHRAGEAIDRGECPVLSLVREEPTGSVRVFDHDTFEREDGTSFIVGMSIAQIIDAGTPTGVAVVFRDISIEKEHEARLALHRAAMDAVAEPIFWLRRDARFIYANAAAERHLGFSREEIKEMTVFDVDPEFQPEDWDAHWDHVKEGGVVEFRGTNLLRSGEQVPVLLKATHVERDGNEFHVTTVRRIDEPAR